jgi:hypothetical protein
LDALAQLRLAVEEVGGDMGFTSDAGEADRGSTRRQLGKRGGGTLGGLLMSSLSGVAKMLWHLSS